MDLKSHPVFGYLLISLGLIAAGEGYWIFNRYSANKAAHKALDKAESDMADLKKVAPFPSSDNAKLIADDLKTIGSTLDSLKAQLKGNGPKAEALLAAKVPATADDFVIDLKTFIGDELAKLAELKPVDPKNKAKDTETFGFSLFQKKGPPPDLLPAVYRQKQIAEYLLDTLLACPHKPDSFISLKREKAYSDADKAAYQQKYVAYLGSLGAKGAASITEPKMPENLRDTGTDIFAIDPLISVRVPNLVGTTAFRLSFEAQTITVREFLDEIEKFEIPVVVRAVEWDPGVEAVADAGESTGTAPADAAGGKAAVPLVVKAKPKVAQKYSRWTITLEYIQLETPMEADAAPASKPGPAK
jgi:hypothetical protein